MRGRGLVEERQIGEGEVDPRMLHMHIIHKLQKFFIYPRHPAMWTIGIPSVLFWAPHSHMGTQMNAFVARLITAYPVSHAPLPAAPDAGVFNSLWLAVVTSYRKNHKSNEVS